MAEETVSDARPSAGEGREVATLLLPLPVRGMSRLSEYLEDAYGKGLVMRQVGDRMHVFAPEHGDGARA